MIGCPDFSGHWVGKAHDTTNLFRKPASISLTLQNEKKRVVGYIDTNSVLYKAGTLIVAQCKNNKLTQLVIFPKAYNCSYTTNIMSFSKGQKLNLTLPWANAMIDASFNGVFNRVRIKNRVNQKWMEDALQINLSRSKNCH